MPRASSHALARRAAFAVAGSLLALAPAASASEVFPTNHPVAVEFHGSTYFVGGSGRLEGLYRSDGTPAGTSLVKHVEAPGGLEAWGLTVRGDQLAFSSEPGYASSARHFVSDGTAAGTRRVASPPPGPPGRVLARMTDGGIYFTKTGSRNDQLGYLPPGPGAAPVMLAPVGDGLTYGVLEREFYFAGTDAQHGREPWVSDGTAAGTRLVADLTPGPASSDFSSAVAPGNTFPSGFVPVGSSMYVLAGRAEGATNVPDTPYLLTGPAPGSPVTIDGAPAVVPLGAQSRGSADALWFQTGYGSTIARYRVPAGGTVAELAPGRGFDEHGTLIVPGERIWVSENSVRSTDAQGSVTVLATTGLSAPSKNGKEPAIYLVTRVGGDIWFMAPVVDNGGWVFWRSDGTPGGTGPVVQPGQISAVSSTLTATAARKRDATRPYRWRIAGTVTPQGLAPGAAAGYCQGTVSLRPTAYGGRRPLARYRAPVRWTGTACTYSRTIAPPRKAFTARRGKLAVSVQFDGTDHVAPESRVRRVGLRYG